MQKKYIYIIAFISIFILGLFIGQSGVKGELKQVTDNLQSAGDRIKYLERTISRSNNAITELENQLTEERKRYREQAEFINKIESGLSGSGETISNLEAGNNTGREIIKSLLKKIDMETN